MVLVEKGNTLRCLNLDKRITHASGNPPAYCIYTFINIYIVISV